MKKTSAVSRLVSFPRVFVRKTATLFRLIRMVRSGSSFNLLDDLGTDLSHIDWTKKPAYYAKQITVKKGPVHIAWIMPPPSAESGGHQNLFRFINFAEQAGHICSIYFYSLHPTDLVEMRNMLDSSDAYPNVQANFYQYDAQKGVDPSVQALFATSWETAYPAFADPTHARRFYFVQDFEPLFYPAGSQALLAENTYRFGFHAITAGGWLAHKLRTEYGMKADHFNFAVDTSIYQLTHDATRNEIFFYARPVTERRAFEFGLLVLEEFSRMRPNVTINMVGWDLSMWNVPFPHVNMTSLPLSELNQVYNRCAAALVLSLSNMSLLPLELISSGVTPVVNDGPNNRMVSDNPYIAYVPASPPVIAQKLAELVDRKDLDSLAKKMSKSVAQTTWQTAAHEFLTAFEGAMRG